MTELTRAPTSKVTAGAIGGAIASVGMGIFAIVEPELYTRVPPGMEGGIAVLVGSLAAYLKSET